MSMVETFLNLPVHQDNLVPLAWDTHHFRSWHSTFCNLHMAWCCHPFSLLTELVRSMVRLRVLLPFELGPWPGPYNLHPQMPLVGNGVAALWAFAPPVPMVCCTRFIQQRSFSFWENASWCLRSSQWITVFSYSVLPSV